MDHTSNSHGEPTQPSWTQRRRMLILVTAFCMITIAYILWQDLQSEVAEVAVTMSFLIMGTNVGSYVFGATWQDVSLGRR